MKRKDENLSQIKNNNSTLITINSLVYVVFLQHVWTQKASVRVSVNIRINGEKWKKLTCARIHVSPGQQICYICKEFDSFFFHQQIDWTF